MDDLQNYKLQLQQVCYLSSYKDGDEFNESLLLFKGIQMLTLYKYANIFYM